MPKKLTFESRSEDEDIKQSGMFLDFDEMAAKGAMSSADASIAKWYGIYKSRHAGNHMARIVIPGGVITTAMARNIAGISERYGQGVVNATTRQALQFHWLKLANLPDMLRELRDTGNSTRHGCGDVTRNVATCPLAETCIYRRFNVRPVGIETANVLTAARDLDDLPRKYKITFSGCGADCAQPHINCCAFSAVSTSRGDGFRVVIGGGMGWMPFVAQPLFGYIPADKAVAVARAVAILFREYGDRHNRAKSRLKFVVHRRGIDFCRQIVLDNLHYEGVNTDQFSVADMADTGPAFPPRPLIEDTPGGTDGKFTVRVIVRGGEVPFTVLRALADLSDRYADQRLYTTNRQNFEFHGVGADDVAPLSQAVRDLGYDTDGSFGLTDIVSCVGTTYCPKAVTETRVLMRDIHQLVTQEKYQSIQKAAIINITGCPNSCSPYRISDIGFRGARIRDESGSSEAYEMLLGGSQTAFGEKLGDFKREDCVPITAIVLDEFMKLRQGDEFLTDCVRRVGIEHFRKVVLG